MSSPTASREITAAASYRIDDVIRDDALRRLARTRSRVTVPVLIEVTQPSGSRETELAPGGRDEAGRPDAVTVVVPRHDHDEPPAEAVRVLIDVLGQLPSYLPAAGAFTCDATGAQLDQLARSPAVQTIRPNRRVKG